MRTLLAIPRWLFWKIVYLFRPGPKTVEAAILEFQRTAGPWRRFLPYVYRNDTGRMWEIYLRDGREYVATHEITAEVGFSLDTGEVTSIRLWDGRLNRVAQKEKKQAEFNRRLIESIFGQQSTEKSP